MEPPSVDSDALRLVVGLPDQIEFVFVVFRCEGRCEVTERDAFLYFEDVLDESWSYSGFGQAAREPAVDCLHVDLLPLSCGHLVYCA